MNIWKQLLQTEAWEVLLASVLLALGHELTETSERVHVSRVCPQTLCVRDMLDHHRAQL